MHFGAVTAVDWTTTMNKAIVFDPATRLLDIKKTSRQGVREQVTDIDAPMYRVKVYENDERNGAIRIRLHGQEVLCTDTLKEALTERDRQRALGSVCDVEMC